MTDIVIHTTPEVLRHKKGFEPFRSEGIVSEPAKSPDNWEKYYYWTLSKIPINCKVGERIWFATKCRVQGSFKITEINKDDVETIVWDADSWEEEEVYKHPTKHFQGFKYKWW